MASDNCLRKKNIVRKLTIYVISNLLDFRIELENDVITEVKPP